MAYPWGTPVKLRKYTAPKGIDSFLDCHGELRKFRCLKRKRNYLGKSNHHNKYIKHDQNIKVNYFRVLKSNSEYKSLSEFWPQLNRIHDQITFAKKGKCAQMSLSKTNKTHKLKRQMSQGTWGFEEGNEWFFNI